MGIAIFDDYRLTKTLPYILVYSQKQQLYIPKNKTWKYLFCMTSLFRGTLYAPAISCYVNTYVMGESFWTDHAYNWHSVFIKVFEQYTMIFENMLQLGIFLLYGDARGGFVGEGARRLILWTSCSEFEPTERQNVSCDLFTNFNSRWYPRALTHMPFCTYCHHHPAPARA